MSGLKRLRDLIASRMTPHTAWVGWQVLATKRQKV